MKDYICRCNNCYNILIDENPKIDAKKSELTGSELYMEKFSDKDQLVEFLQENYLEEEQEDEE